MNTKIVTIARLTYSRALLARGKLESEGIECVLSNVNLIQSDVGSGVNVRVREQDAAKAEVIIEQMKGASGKDKEESLKKIKAVRRILVPVDFSDHSENACLYALGMAAVLKAEIRLLHVYLNPAYSPAPFNEIYSYPANLDNLVYEIEKEAEQNIKRLKKKLKTTAKEHGISNIRIGYELQSGVADDTILEVMDVYKPGVLVIGTRGLGDSTERILGSVTTRVLEKAEIPVLVIPEKSTYSGVKNIQNALYATSLEEGDFNSINKLTELLRPFNVDVKCLHVSQSEEKEEAQRLGEFKSRFQESFGLNLTCDVVRNEDVLDGIEDYIQKNRIDLLAMTTHRRNLLMRIFNPSLTKKMLFHAKVPMLVFHN